MFFSNDSKYFNLRKWNNICEPGITGYYYSGTVIQDGTGYTSFTNLSNIVGDTTSSASVFLIGDDGNLSYSNFVDVTNFGFNLLSYQTVVGIEYKIKYSLTKEAAAEVGFSTYLQLLINGVPSGTNLGNYTTFLNEVSSELIIGDSTSLFGLTPTYSDINNSNFGIRFQLFNDGGTGRESTTNIKAVGMNIYTGC